MTGERRYQELAQRRGRDRILHSSESPSIVHPGGRPPAPSIIPKRSSISGGRGVVGWCRCRPIPIGGGSAPVCALQLQERRRRARGQNARSRIASTLRGTPSGTKSIGPGRAPSYDAPGTQLRREARGRGGGCREGSRLAVGGRDIDIGVAPFRFERMRHRTARPNATCGGAVVRNARQTKGWDVGHSLFAEWFGKVQVRWHRVCPSIHVFSGITFVMLAWYATGNCFLLAGQRYLPQPRCAFHTASPIGTATSYSNNFCRRSASTTETSLRMGLPDLSWRASSRSGATGRSDGRGLEVGEEVGSGSYGTVHLCRLAGDDADDGAGAGGEDAVKIAKRAWTEGELRALDRTGDSAGRGARERAERCRYYIDVERHCLEKLTASDDEDAGKYVPRLVGVRTDGASRPWLVCDLVGPDGGSAGGRPARTLSDVLAEDRIDRERARDDDEADDPGAPRRRLRALRRAFGMDDGSTFGDALDTALVGLLRAVAVVNSHNIVHRDVKPQNLLVHSGGGGSLVGIDFGSGEC